MSFSWFWKFNQENRKNIELFIIVIKLVFFSRHGCGNVQRVAYWCWMKEDFEKTRNIESGQCAWANLLPQAIRIFKDIKGGSTRQRLHCQEHITPSGSKPTKNSGSSRRWVKHPYQHQNRIKGTNYKANQDTVRRSTGPAFLVILIRKEYFPFPSLGVGRLAQGMGGLGIILIQEAGNWIRIQAHAPTGRRGNGETITWPHSDWLSPGLLR